MLDPERFVRDMNANDSVGELFRTMASMGVNVGSINRDKKVPPPAPPPSPASGKPPLMHPREMDIDDYITFYTYGSQNLASRGVQSSSSTIIESTDDSSQGNLKQISDIIESKEVIKELSDKGEVISHLFEKQLLAKLEASGLMSEDAVDSARTTSVKFAKWVEEILSECEKRKSHRKFTELDDIIFNKKKDESIQDNSAAVRTETELVRINEISDDEIEKRFGELLRDSSKHVLFHFESADRQPRIVVHLLTESNVKEMIVREMTSDMYWSNWLIEIGSQDRTANNKNSIGMNHEPDFTSEDTPKIFAKETKSVEGKTQEALKNSKFEWDANTMKNIFGNKNYYGKVPLLKRQCVSTSNDCGVEYPIFLPKFSGSIAGKLFDFEGTEVIFPMPPQQNHTET